MLIAMVVMLALVALAIIVLLLLELELELELELFDMPLEPSIVGINCMVSVKPDAGTVLLKTWYCKTPMSVAGSLAAFWFAGSATNFVNASFEGARSVMPWALASIFVNAGWVASSAKFLLVKGCGKLVENLQFSMLSVEF